MDSIITQVTKEQVEQQTNGFSDHGGGGGDPQSPQQQHQDQQSSKQNSLLRQRRINVGRCPVQDKSSSSSTASSKVEQDGGTNERGNGVSGTPVPERNAASSFLRKLLNSCCCCVRRQGGGRGKSEGDGKVCGETRGGGGRDAWDSSGGEGRNVDLFVGGGSGSVGGGSSSSSGGSNDEIDSVSAGVCSVVVSGERGSGDGSRGSGGGGGGFLLPACLPQDRSKPCMVIDLDETLVHSSFKPISNADFIVPVEIDGVVHQVYVAKRPYVDEFLQKMGELYECVLFTASLAKYADPVADLLDKWGVFRTRLFRDACVFHRGNYVKDLNKLGRSLHRVVIVDNSPASYIFHPDNAVPVASWFDDTSDTELLYLIPFFERLSSVDNVYTVLRNSNHPYNSIKTDVSSAQPQSTTSNLTQPPLSPQSTYSIIHNISPPTSPAAQQQSTVQSYDVTSTSSESHHEIIYNVSNNYNRNANDS